MGDRMPYPTALTIAGSDSGGGAGIQADLKTFLDHRVFGMSAIAAVTAQNTRGVFRIDALPPEGLRAQLDAVFDDLPVGAVKIGMLGNAALVNVVADVLERLDVRPPVVLDPVMVASTGARLLEADAEEALRHRLLPLATVVTPNLAELAVLAGTDDRHAGNAWALAQPVAVLATGGDPDPDSIDDDIVVDALYRPGFPVRRFSAPRIHPAGGNGSFHGTGCTVSSAIAARLAHGQDLDDAVDGAITYVQHLLRRAVELGSPGHGNPVLPHGLE